MQRIAAHVDRDRDVVRSAGLAASRLDVNRESLRVSPADACIVRYGETDRLRQNDARVRALDEAFRIGSPRVAAP